MIKPRDRQPSFEEQWRPNLLKKEAILDEIDAFVDWEPIEKRLIKMYRRDMFFSLFLGFFSFHFTYHL